MKKNQAEIMGLFPTPVMKRKYEGNLINTIKFLDSCKMVGDFPQVYGTTSQDIYILENKQCYLLKNFILESITNFATQISSTYIRVDHLDKDGVDVDIFLNLVNQGNELIIQDELHLLLGPLGSAVGLFEKSIDYLCTYEENGLKIKPKIITSTATTRNTDKQIFALFNRRSEIFPKQGIEFVTVLGISFLRVS
jgi:hypothetical protein